MSTPYFWSFIRDPFLPWVFPFAWLIKHACVPESSRMSLSLEKLEEKKKMYEVQSANAMQHKYP